MTCSKCGFVGTESDFHRDKSKAKGFVSHCKVCACTERNARNATPEARAKRAVYDAIPEVRAKRAVYDATPEVRARKEAYRANRYANDINFRLTRCLRSRFRIAIHHGLKTGSSVKNLECSINDFRLYIESKWQPGMSWENWSLRGWHIDHIRPLASFNLSDPEQVKLAVHFSNLQPLWARDNIKKSAKLDWTKK